MSIANDAVKPPRRCRQCGAVLDESAQGCWLCAAVASAEGPAESEEPFGPRPSSPESNPWLIHGAIWLSLAVASVVGYGVLVENLVLGLGYTIAVAPPLLITLLASAMSRSAGRPIHPAAKVALGAGITVLSLSLSVVVMVLAVIVGLFQLCTTGESTLLEVTGR